MAVMATLDIVMGEYKLSDAQKNAVIELLSGGFTTAKPNTVKSLEKKGLITFNEGWEFEPGFHEKLREGYSQPNYRSVEELQSLAASQGIKLTHESAVEAIENELNTNMWDAPVITEEESEQFEEIVKTKFDHFDSQWDAQLKRTAGFGETLKWSNTKVWDGLTAEEIREDLDTAGPVNRKVRRKGQRERRNFLRMIEGKGGRNRKKIKICGGKG